VAFASTRGWKPKITHQFYTSDFYYFGQKSESDIYTDVGTIRYFNRKSYCIGLVLEKKKKDFYNLLHKYMLVREIITISELSKIINSKIDFGRLLITVKYTHNTNMFRVYDTSYPY
jgi:hypothetical protein